MKRKLLYTALVLGVFVQSGLSAAETIAPTKTNLWADGYYGTGSDPVTLDTVREICKGALWDGMYFVSDDAVRCDWPNRHIQWGRLVTCPDSSWRLDYYKTKCIRPDNVQPPASEFVNAGQTDCKQLVGNPINVGVASKLEQQTDLVFPGQPDLTLVRTFNSRYLPVSPVFPWATNFHKSAKVSVEDGQRTLEFHRGDGKMYVFHFDGQNWHTRTTPHITVSEERDTQGNTIGWQYADANSRETEHYDAQGKLLTVARLNGQTLRFTYSDGTVSSGTAVDRDGQPTEMALEAGLLTKVTDSFGHTLYFGYNILGRLYDVQGPDNQRVTYRYDHAGSLNQVSYADGAIRRYLHENATYSAALTGIINELGQRTLTVTYDDKGRAISTEHADGVNKYQVTYNSENSASVTDPLGTTRQYSFTSINGAVKTTDLSQPCPTGCGQSGKHTDYDTQGNPVRITDWNNTVTEYAYDPVRHLELRRTEGLQDQGGSSIVQPETRTIVTSWHATFAEPLTISEYIGGVNASGQPTGALQKQTVYTYDNQGNPLTRIEKSGTDSRQWKYQYGSLGRIKSVMEPNGVSSLYAYYPDDDADPGRRGQLKQTANNATHITQVTAYTADGQPSRIVDPNGKVTELTYDTRGRVTSQQTGGQRIDYTYDAAGQLTQAQGNDGTRLEYGYDNAGRLIRVSDHKGNRIDYTLDNLGNRLSEITSGPGGAQLKQIERQYNPLNQLKQISGNE